MKLIDPYRGRVRPKPSPSKSGTQLVPKDKGSVSDAYLRGRAGGEAHPFYFRTDRTRQKTK
jgi:hypothetical protein